ncbi:hypothetical protein CXG81DRAFT_23424 [Caulochytrium protostelioides]|uniref:Uncharacterized protein n=2 Tax=Caulochytrium protostelioides TaxID=1555241 RepID=A0A4P9XFK3_9FUNG|nr:hypothetical protein CXG81DRAFT_23424 [Caulochytrium protostelioides]|eukprot:RKP04011.1 hypothetical protein CXG81DRAFT_23424 [Caulochytrium protostelioides]
MPNDQPEAILLLDSGGVNVLDSVATDYEDSFCLDTLGDLALAHDATEPAGTKSFILARVQTWDPRQPDKAYYSYYNAYHLNKILFQTQIYIGKKLIHRLHVLNPLTNTDIIGNVQYFMVRLHEADQGRVAFPLTAIPPGILKSNPSGPASPVAPGAGAGLLGETGIAPAVPTDLNASDASVKVTDPLMPEGTWSPYTASAKDVADYDAIDMGDPATLATLAPGTAPVAAAALADAGAAAAAALSARPGVSHPADAGAGAGADASPAGIVTRKREPLFINTTAASSDAIAPRPHAAVHSAHGLPPPSPGVRQLDQGLAQHWTFTSPSACPLEDDEPVLSAVSCPPSRAGGGPRGPPTRLTLLRPTFAGPHGRSLRHRASPVMEETRITVTPAVIHGGPAPRTPGMASPLTGAPRSAPIQGVVRPAAGPVAMRGHHWYRTPARPGVVTRFTVPVPASELAALVTPTARTRRRSLSYSNAVAQLGHWASVNEWVERVHADKARYALIAEEPNADYDAVADFGGAAAPPGSATAARPLSPLSPLRVPAESGHGGSDRETVAAVEAQARGQFWRAILFATDSDFLESSKIRAVFRDNACVPEDATLFEMKPFTGEPDVPMDVFVVDETNVCEFCFPTSYTLSQLSPRMRVFHRSKIWLILLVLVAVILCFIFLISRNNNGTTGTISATTTPSPTISFAGVVRRGLSEMTRPTATV